MTKLFQDDFLYDRSILRKGSRLKSLRRTETCYDTTYEAQLLPDSRRAPPTKTVCDFLAPTAGQDDQAELSS